MEKGRDFLVSFYIVFELFLYFMLDIIYINMIE